MSRRALLADTTSDAYVRFYEVAEAAQDGEEREDGELSGPFGIVVDVRASLFRAGAVFDVDRAEQVEVLAALDPLVSRFDPAAPDPKLHSYGANTTSVRVGLGAFLKRARAQLITSEPRRPQIARYDSDLASAGFVPDDDFFEALRHLVTRQLMLDPGDGWPLVLSLPGPRLGSDACSAIAEDLFESLGAKSVLLVSQAEAIRWHLGLVSAPCVIVDVATDATTISVYQGPGPAAVTVCKQRLGVSAVTCPATLDMLQGEDDRESALLRDELWLRLIFEHHRFDSPTPVDVDALALLEDLSLSPVAQQSVADIRFDVGDFTPIDELFFGTTGILAELTGAVRGAIQRPGWSELLQNVCLVGEGAGIPGLRNKCEAELVSAFGSACHVTVPDAPELAHFRAVFTILQQSSPWRGLHPPDCFTSQDQYDEDGPTVLQFADLETVVAPQSNIKAIR
jgi:hypothetical protein